MHMENAQQGESAASEAEDGATSNGCTLFDKWSKSDNSSILNKITPSNTGGGTTFQSVLGISSLEISMKNRHAKNGDSYPFHHTSLDTSDMVIKP